MYETAESPYMIFESRDQYEEHKQLKSMVRKMSEELAYFVWDLTNGSVRLKVNSVYREKDPDSQHAHYEAEDIQTMHLSKDLTWKMHNFCCENYPRHDEIVLRSTGKKVTARSCLLHQNHAHLSQDKHREPN